MKSVPVMLCAIALAAATATPPAYAARSSKGVAVPSTVTVTIDVRGASLADVIAMLAAQSHTNIVLDSSVPQTTVTLRLHGVSLQEALEALESAYSLADVQRQNYRVIVSAKASGGFGDTVGMVTRPIDIPTGNATKIAQALTGQLPAGTFVNATDDRTLVVSGSENSVARVRQLATAMAGGDQYGMTLVPVNYSTPAEMLQRLQNLHVISTDSQVIANDAELVVGGSPSFRASVANAVRVLDVPTKQVTYTIQVLALEPQNDKSNRGILWGQGTINGQGQITINPGSTTTGFTDKFLPIAAQISELVSSGSASVLATPSIVVPNGGENAFHAGETIPIQTNNNGLVGGSQVQFYEIGVNLDVKAQIGSDGDVTSVISASYSDILGYDPFSHLPIIAVRSDDAKGVGVRVHDGESIILAGMFDDSDTDAMSKIPGIGDIPLIGQLFRQRQRTHTRDQLVFVITPHIGVQHPSADLKKHLQGGGY